jgi:hypothetical protein
MKEITIEAKCIMIGRMPRDGHEFKTVVIRVFDENNAHKKDIFPIDTLEFPDVEKVRVRGGLFVTYYSEGNDIVINNLEEIKLQYKDNVVEITGSQDSAKCETFDKVE